MNAATNVSRATSGSAPIGMVAAVSIGVGGMVGAGIFSILGVVAHAAGNAMWLAFAIGGVVALLSTYSYAKLGATFPSAGGAVHFLVKSFGDGVLAGVVLLTVVNALGAKFMGRSETVIVVIKVAILVLFAAVGLWFIRPGYLS